MSSSANGAQILNVSLLSGDPQGTTLMISGTGFDATTSVYIGNKLCATLTSSETEITCQTPSYSVWHGKGPVAVKKGSAFAVSEFTFTPEILLGQFTYTSGLMNHTNTVIPNASSMRRPYGVESNRSKLVISDNDNHRILIWNSIPTTFGQPADVILGQANASGYLCNRGISVTADSFCLPRDAKIYGNKLIVTDSSNNRVLIWNQFPTSVSDLPDVVLGQNDFTSNSPGTTANKFSMPTSLDVDDSGRLYVFDMNNNRMLIWNSIPAINTNPNADIVLGQVNFTDGCINNCSLSGVLSASGFYQARGFKILPGNRLAVADYGNNRVLIWNHLPTESNRPADLVLGQASMTTNTGNYDGIQSYTMRWPVDVASTGDDLWVADYGNHRVLYWEHFPVTEGQSATHVFGQNDFTSGSANMGSGTNKDNLYQPLGLEDIGKDVIVVDGLNNRAKLLINPNN